MGALSLLAGGNRLYGADTATPSSERSPDSKATSEWTINALVAHAFAFNPELRSYQAALAAAIGERTQAGLWNNPDVSGLYGDRRVSDPASGAQQGRGFTVSGDITQKFEFPGKATLRKAIADKNIEVANLGIRQFRLALAGQVKNLAYQYLAASANADTMDEIVQRDEALIELFRRRPKAGSSQMLEAQVIEGNLFELRRKIKDAVQLREEARINLNTLVGLPPSMLLRLQDRLTVPRLDRSVGQLALQGSSDNLLLKIRASELQAAADGVGASRLDAAPDFTIGAFYSEDKAQDDEVNMGMSLSLPLPLWNQNQGNIAAAKARQQQADDLLDDARQKVQGEIERRYRVYLLDLQLLGKFPETDLAKLGDSADLADRQYRTGGIGLQLFLDVQQTYLNSQTARNETVLEVWQSYLDLQLLTGDSSIPSP